MKDFFGYFRNYAAAELNPGYLLTVTLFVAVSLSVNYRFDLETRILRSLESGAEVFLFYLIFFSFPYAVSIALYRIFKGPGEFLRRPGFYVLSALMIAGLAFEASTEIGAGAAEAFVAPRYAPLFALAANNLMQAALWFLPAFLYWLAVDRKETGLYGFTLKSFSLRPYFLILMIMTPAVFFFSGAGDFLHAYPRYRLANLPADGANLPCLLLFELCYGLAYVSVEFYFRGFMVMALGRYLGAGGIVPVSVVYCFIHFQKPLAEAASSFFGGLALGIISFYGGSIYGGIIVHLGTAWLMEAAALWRMLR